MNYFYSFLLLLVVLSAYSDSPHHSKPPDPLDLTLAAVCSNSSSDPLSILAPVLSQNEISISVLSQNMVLPQSEVFGFVMTLSGVLNTPSGVLNIVGGVVMTLSGVLNTPGGVFKIVIVDVMTPSGVLNTLGGVFKIVTINCQLFNNLKTIIKLTLNFDVENFKILTSTLIHGAETFAWSTRILLESLQHVLKIYTWSLSENQSFVQFKCRLIALMLKRSLFT